MPLKFLMTKKIIIAIVRPTTESNQPTGLTF